MEINVAIVKNLTNSFQRANVFLEEKLFYDLKSRGKWSNREENREWVIENINERLS